MAGESSRPLWERQARTLYGDDTAAVWAVTTNTHSVGEGRRSLL